MVCAASPRALAGCFHVAELARYPRALNQICAARAQGINEEDGSGGNQVGRGRSDGAVTRPPRECHDLVLRGLDRHGWRPPLGRRCPRAHSAIADDQAPHPNRGELRDVGHPTVRVVTCRTYTRSWSDPCLGGGRRWRPGASEGREAKHQEEPRSEGRVPRSPSASAPADRHPRRSRHCATRQTTACPRSKAQRRRRVRASYRASARTPAPRSFGGCAVSPRWLAALASRIVSPCLGTTPAVVGVGPQGEPGRAPQTAGGRRRPSLQSNLRTACRRAGKGKCARHSRHRLSIGRWTWRSDVWWKSRCVHAYRRHRGCHGLRRQSKRPGSARR